jgi:hypothetical protein
MQSQYSKWWFNFYSSDHLAEFRDAKLRRSVAASQRLRMPLSDADSELSNALYDTLFTVDWRRREVR